MYTKEEREGILWEFHRSGLSAPAACRSLPLFPNKDNLYAWLKLEEAGELTAREMPDRAERMHCSHGEGSPAFAARRPGTEPASPRKRRAEGGAGKMERTGRGGAGGEPPEQTDWRDWGLEGLPDDPAERAPPGTVHISVANPSSGSTGTGRTCRPRSTASTGGRSAGGSRSTPTPT